MSKKKKNNNKYAKLIGAKVIGINESKHFTEIKLKLKNGKYQSIGVEDEGSYTDWWEVFVSYRPNSEIAYYTENEEDGEKPKITIRFYNDIGQAVLTITGIFHNDSDWDYGCYLHVTAEDLGIREFYYV